MTKIIIGDAVEVRGQFVKIIGGPIVRIPKNHTCVITGFYVENKNIIHYGEIYFKPQDDENPVLLELAGNFFVNSEN